MTRLIELLISLAIVLALFLIVGFLLPSSRHFETSVETNRKMTIVYDTLNSFRRFDEWNVLVAHDPGMERKLAGPEEGVGARFEYSSDQKGVGDGSWEIVDSKDGQSVSYTITNNQRGKNKRTTFLLEPTGRNDRNVKITQTYDVDYGMNLLGRYAGMYVSSNMGQEMKMSLARLSNMLAAVPNYDYDELSKDDPSMAPRVEQRQASNLLVVGAQVERNNDVVQRTMKNNMQWIDKVMKANDLVADGPVRIITNELGGDSYSFEVAQPVRKADGASEDDAAASEDEAADEEADTEVADAGEEAAAPAGQLDIELQGPVKQVYVEAGTVAAVPFKGHMANLSKVRDALRGWALTRGYQTVDRPYESWNNGLDQGFTEEGEFVVYWSIK
ncbi:SRPBCC family protein [Lysobacter sp. F60174L2]|uniref:SRPBCC family protein n=1 Tax=Lysobacter sp. F60174L2 TaxID=3459295 RepID=UPI00403DABC6